MTHQMTQPASWPQPVRRLEGLVEIKISMDYRAKSTLS
jgi:hypothetical protein